MGAGAAWSVERPTQVMILRFMGARPSSGSVLTAGSWLWILLPLPHSHSAPPPLKNKHYKKIIFKEGREGGCPGYNPHRKPGFPTHWLGRVEGGKPRFLPTGG